MSDDYVKRLAQARIERMGGGMMNDNALPRLRLEDVPQLWQDHVADPLAAKLTEWMGQKGAPPVAQALTHAAAQGLGASDLPMEAFGQSPRGREAVDDMTGALGDYGSAAVLGLTKAAAPVAASYAGGLYERGMGGAHDSLRRAAASKLDSLALERIQNQGGTVLPREQYQQMFKDANYPVDGPQQSFPLPEEAGPVRSAQVEKASVWLDDLRGKHHPKSEVPIDTTEVNHGQGPMAETDAEFLNRMAMYKGTMNNKPIPVEPRKAALEKLKGPKTGAERPSAKQRESSP